MVIVTHGLEVFLLSHTNTDTPATLSSALFSFSVRLFYHWVWYLIW